MLSTQTADSLFIKACCRNIVRKFELNSLYTWHQYTWHHLLSIAKCSCFADSLFISTCWQIWQYSFELVIHDAVVAIDFLSILGSTFLNENMDLFKVTSGVINLQICISSSWMPLICKLSSALRWMCCLLQHSRFLLCGDQLISFPVQSYPKPLWVFDIYTNKIARFCVYFDHVLHLCC